MWGHEVLRFSESGARSLVHRFDDAEDPGGLGWLPNGELLVVGMEGRCVYRLSGTRATRPTDSIATSAPHAPHATAALAGALPASIHADLSALAAWPCNDMIVRRDGTAWVSHFGYDMWGGTTGFLPATLLRVRPDGRVDVVAEDLLAPNGMAFPPDEQTLFLSECGRSQILAFDVLADGSLANRRVHAALPCAPGLAFAPPDGICLDEAGAVWAAEPIGKRVLRIDRAGCVTDEIAFDQSPLAIALGGADRRTLFVCSSVEHDKPHRGVVPTGRVDALRVEVPGAGRP
jgi:sugar lactone lactonase YvrE